MQPELLPGTAGCVVLLFDCQVGSSLPSGAELAESDPFDEEIAIEDKSRERQRSKHLKRLEDLDNAADGVDVSRHFSYYAWEGGAGEIRWKHEVCSLQQCTFRINTAPQHAEQLDHHKSQLKNQRQL